jgi:hypothetical protein
MVKKLRNSDLERVSYKLLKFIGQNASGKELANYFYNFYLMKISGSYIGVI